MTAFDKAGQWGAVCKWNFGASSNTRRGLPYILGLILLSDGETGETLAAIDSTSVTSVRTAAATAVAARHLARAGTRTLAIIGCCVEARTNATSLPYVLPELSTIRAYDINRETLDRCSPNSRAASAALVLPQFTIRRILARWFGFFFGLRPAVSDQSKPARNNRN